MAYWTHLFIWSASPLSLEREVQRSKISSSCCIISDYRHLFSWSLSWSVIPNESTWLLELLTLASTLFSWSISFKWWLFKDRWSSLNLSNSALRCLLFYVSISKSLLSSLESTLNVAPKSPFELSSEVNFEICKVLNSASFLNPSSSNLSLLR